MKIVILVAALLSSVSAFAGANNTEIKCKSADGKLVIEGMVPGDFAEFDLTITAAGQKYSMYSRINQTTGQTEENAMISVTDAAQDSVYTLEARWTQNNKYGMIRLYALPKSVKFKARGSRRDASFTAKASFYGADLLESIEAKVTCTTHYSI